MMSREQIIRNNPLDTVLIQNGVNLRGTGTKRVAKCPFHEDSNPSFSVDLQKQVWNCHAGCGGGSVIDFLAKLRNVSVADVMKDLDGTRNGNHRSLAPLTPAVENKPTIEKVYSYRDALGREVFQVVRLRPKSFRQRHQENGQWVWNMDGVERVLYHLPEVIKAQTVWIAEGEKDADKLSELGFVATCNVGGAGKWLDSYTESLAGKDVVLCGDTDKPGKEHVELVFESIAGKVRTARIVELPKQFKDVSEFIDSFNSNDDAKKALDGLFDVAQPFTKGIRLPIYRLDELEMAYQRHVQRLSETSLDLGKWLPSLGRQTRSLVAGELMVVAADTGVGKTAILMNIALAADPLPTLVFELELPGELMYERFVALKTKMECRDVERAYAIGDTLGEQVLTKRFPHLYICSESRLTTEILENYIFRSELKIGRRPVVVLIDYVQLIQGRGNSRYERMSSIAEDLKVIAKATQTIIIIASQVHRKSEEDDEIYLHDAKDSGSIENSAGLVLGAWRDRNDKRLMHLKVLKNTKGSAGVKVECNYDGATTRIVERSPVSENDLPPLCK